jgi:hypothetical protein
LTVAAKRPDGKPAKAERITFTRPAAERIGRVVRIVESGDRSAEGLSFERVDTPRERKQFRVVTITSDWNKDETKTVTFYNQTSTPNTVSATNLLFYVEGPQDPGGEKICVIGKEGTAWYFINNEKDTCEDLSYRAKELSPSASDSSLASEIIDSSGPQVLVNDNGCVTWKRLYPAKLVKELEEDNGGIKWIEQELWVFLKEEGEEKVIACEDIGETISAGTLTINHGSGTIQVTGDCDTGREIDIDITLDTTSCEE